MKGITKEMIEGFPLSPQQKHLWLVQQAGGASPFCAQCAILMEGDLDTALLKATLERIINRHEILRTVFPLPHGLTFPIQAVTSIRPVIEECDLNVVNTRDQESRIEALLDEARRRPFDFERGSLLRVCLAFLSPRRHILLITLPSLCADSATLNNLGRELCRSYAARMNNEEPTKEPIQYADLAQWQNELLEVEETAIGRDYWRRQQRHVSKCFSLPLSFANRLDEKQEFEPEIYRSVIGPEELQRIETLLRRRAVSLPSLLLACWLVLLWRLTGEQEIVVGTAYDGRKYEELKETLGLLTRYLPVYIHLDEDLTFGEVLKQVDEATREAGKWQDSFAWEQILSPDSNGGEAPFSILSFESEPEFASCSARTVRFSIEKRYCCADRFKIKLSCIEKDHSLIAEFHYDASSFRVKDIERLAEQFHTLVKSAVSSPESFISALEIVGDAERQQVLIEFNQTGTAYPLNQCIHELFEEQVELTPDAVAVAFEEEQLSYRELNRRANQLAHYLRALGVGPEVRVGICLERSFEMLVAIWGTLKAGGAYVPLDPQYPRERIAFMLEDTDVPVLLAQRRLVEELPPHAARVVCLDSDWNSIARESEDNPPRTARAENLVYVIYTSGSTGKPKGSMISHRALVNHALHMSKVYGLKPRQRLLQFFSLSFDASAEDIFPTLISGATLVCHHDPFALSASDFLNFCERHGVNALHLPVAYWHQLVDAVVHKKLTVPFGLEVLTVGGESPSASKLQTWADCTGHRVKFCNVYGPTEATITNTVYETDGSVEATHPNKVPIGRPISNTQIYLLDTHLRPVPIGVPGELHVGGAGLARGYLKRPEATAEKFIPDPFSREPGARMYRTGDLAHRLACGNIEFLGRRDQQVKIRGFRIELEEIEAALKSHRAVREATVLALEDAPGDKRLVAYVMGDELAPPSTVELRWWLKERLPEHMVPSDFLILDALPLTPSGKVDRRALPSPDRTRPELEDKYVAPRTPLEEVLSGIWAEVLGVERVGIFDSFFELGGHSLLAAQMISQVREVLQVGLSVRSLFEEPMVAGFAAKLLGAAGDSAKVQELATLFSRTTSELLADLPRRQSGPSIYSPLVEIQPGAAKRPLFCIHPAGGGVLGYYELARHLGQDQPVYGLQALGLNGEREPLIRIEEMASHYIEALQRVQPQGPYCLAGHSMGGVVAFEMALQLRKHGHEVALIAMLDSWAPAHTLEEDAASVLAQFARDLNLPISVDDLRLVGSDKQLNYFLEQARIAGAIPPDVGLLQARRVLHIYTTNIQAVRNYRPQTSPCQITLFRAQEWVADTSHDPTLGWSKLVMGGIDVHMVPGDHHTMIHEPHVKILAEQLRACIGR
jgi:amino acid adenylation domain-containing protein